MRQKKINDILKFLRRSKGLQSIERYRSSLHDERNTVAEHSWRLGLMAMVIGAECKVQVDMSRTLSLALVHDLAEVTTGDVDAYEQIMGGKRLKDDKAISEESAMREMTDDIPFGDWIYSLWREYQDQLTIEAKFLSALDKIEGFLHIAEDGVEMYIPKEFHASYADKAVAAFDEATHHFPELNDLLDAVKKDLKEKFKHADVAWID